MTPWLPSRLVLAGSSAGEVAAALAGTDDLDVRVAGEGGPGPEDLAWADSFSGVAAPDGLVGSGVRWVHTMAAGVDRMVDALTGSDIVLTRTIGSMPRAIGTYVLAHVLPEMLRVAEYRAQQDRHEWRQLPPARVERRRAVVVGTGGIGAGVAEVLRAVGLSVVGLSASGRPRPGFAEVAALRDGAKHLAACDLLVLALPLTDETRGLVGAEVLGSLEGAVVVNVGRGATLDHEALRGALADGSVRRAVLDVFETEPLPADDWRWGHDAVTVTPHVSGPTDPRDIAEELLAARAEIAEGRTPAAAVDMARGY